jgi:DNA-binding NarL/FixJ family response regulator
MTLVDELDRGREAFGSRAWADAHALLSAAGAQTALEPDDLERLATAAYMTGKDADSEATWARAHQELVSRGDTERAARCAFWLVFGLLNKGERTRAGAWIARARGLLDGAGLDCVEQGYLLVAATHLSIAEGDLASVYAGFSRAAEVGERFRDPDLMALARHSRGRILLRMGRISEGVTLLDQAMIDVETEGLSPQVVGDVYCSVIEGCLEIFDVRRAREWTAALARWCDSQPDLVPYSGQCLVRQSEMLQLRGAWPDAVDAAARACERFLRGPRPPALGAAFYQQAELHRLRGELEGAEEAYREASRYGRNPLPGLAWLRLAQGRLKDAEAAVRRALDEATSRPARSRLLPVGIEVMLARGDVASARTATDELARIAGDLEAELLDAASARARGAVLLAEGDARAALAALRRAWTVFQEIGAPYEAARVRVLIGLACRALDDRDAADMELDAARSVFEGLQARLDLARVEELLRQPAAGRAPGGLTAREVEVLRLVAGGKTNRAIADELAISERTVERHLSNIFAKLDVSSRAAATAYAYEHRLV